MFRNNFKKLLGVLALLVLVGASILVVQNIDKVQNLVQNAAGPAVCSTTEPVDVMLIFDASGSMDEDVERRSDLTKLEAAQKAATSFVNKMAARTETPKNFVGFSSFNESQEVALEQPLTDNYTIVKSKISNTRADGNTCIECGIKDATKAYEQNDRAGVKNVAILLSDGRANSYVGSRSSFNETEAEKRATNAALESYTKFGVTYYTIGFGRDANPTFLKDIATKTGGKYYFAPDDAALNTIYQEISTLIGKGEITGTVFTDINNNKIQDTSESGLNGQTVELRNPTTDAVLKTAQTDTTGVYRISELCQGAYKAEVKPGSGYQQTYPQNPNFYSIVITDGNVVANQNFGLSTASASPTLTSGPTATITLTPTLIPTSTLVPTLTPTLTPTGTGTPSAQTTKISLTAFLHGVGQSGDNQNPNVHTLSNKTPIHPQRTIDVEVYNAQNQKVADTSGTITYDVAEGNFKGIVDLGTTVPPGPYTIKIKPDSYLRRLIPGIHTFVADQPYAAPTVALVAGDSNNDNLLNILDYNIIRGCYSSIGPATSCSETLKLQSDLNDDGNVNQFDYNLFLRELSIQTGE